MEGIRYSSYSSLTRGTLKSCFTGCGYSSETAGLECVKHGVVPREEGLSCWFGCTQWKELMQQEMLIDLHTVRVLVCISATLMDRLTELTANVIVEGVSSLPQPCSLIPWLHFCSLVVNAYIIDSFRVSMVLWCGIETCTEAGKKILTLSVTQLVGSEQKQCVFCGSEICNEAHFPKPHSPMCSSFARSYSFKPNTSDFSTMTRNGFTD